MKNLLRFFSMISLVSLSVLAYAQPAPVCYDLNIGIGSDDSVSIVVGDFVPNAALSLPTITVENPFGGVLAYVVGADATTIIRIAACSYAGRELKLVASNAIASCWSKITFKQSNGPIIVGRDTTVYCSDPLVEGGHIGGAPPLASLPCTGDVPARYVADWVEVFDCVLGNDTAKIIYRMYEAYDKFGTRGIGSDTIVVFRLPQITETNTYCAERDTTYCGAFTGEYFGPYMVVPTFPGSLLCDTIYFVNPDGTAADIDPKCGLAVAVTRQPFGEGCISVIKYVVELKQTCYGTPVTAACILPPSDLEFVAEGYYRCTFWLMDIDTFPPVVECASSDTLIVTTGSHDCAAHLVLPPVTASDSCHDVVAVKARIEGYGSFAMTLQGGQWVSNQTVKIPYTDNVTAIIYEAFDECHNVGYDTCYIRVKDLVAPVAVCDKAVNVSLSGKKVWVSAETFDEGSWDNCGINMLLVRRSDWQEACVLLCDSVVPISTPYGTIYSPYLETNKSIAEIEAHYAKVLEWLQYDDQPCGELVYRAWRYDLMKYATFECEEVNPHFLDFDLAAEYVLGSEDFAKVKQIGGGWADDVLFTCDDACGPVTVEILVMDYWCNFNKCWTEVWVEDKTPISIPKDVVAEIDISCKSYKDDNYTLGGLPASIEDLVAAADAGSLEAFDALDEIFGGYHKAWIGPVGNFLDDEGQEIDCEIDFVDSVCVCTTTVVPTLVYDDHFGWNYAYIEGRECGYIGVDYEWNHGVVAVNCAANVQCDQEIWFQFDHCGQGVIFRKFKIYQGCPTNSTSSTHKPDTITRIQKIWVGNQCELDAGMFTVPRDTILDVCDLVFDADLSGNVSGEADPDFTGRPEYLFDDDCRLVGVGYYDKVFKIVGGDQACYKIIRTWCFADWCQIDKPITDNWLQDASYSGYILKYEQKIILNDTVPPGIVITPLPGGDVVSAGGCLYDFSTTVDVTDACGVLSYRWVLFKNGATVGQGSGDLDLGDEDDFEVSVPGLGTGSYILRVIVNDDCQNEGVAEYEFDITTTKKPSPVCITSITVELTPMDLDNDGVIDTGMAVVWAEEFNSSSIAACDDDSIAFYLEFIDGINDLTLDPEDADSLAIGCDHLPGPQVVRMWVKSFPSGTTDYCDVVIVVQNNMMACGDVSAAQGGVTGNITTELETNVEQVNVKAELSSGQQLDFLTTSSGAYVFASSLGVDVTISPVKDIDHMNGISTADLIQIQKHILGKQLLENTYREIAADVNNDQRITALDLLVLRKLILGKIDELPDVDSWKFVNSIDNKDTYTIQGLNSRMRVDFTGIKMGDVNVTNDPSRNAGRTASNLILEVADQMIMQGVSYEIPVRAANFHNIEGYQFTLNVDASKVRINQVKMGEALMLGDENFGFERISEGIVTTSWNDTDVRALDKDEVLFTLVIEGLAETTLSNVLAVNSKITSAEAYTSSNELLGVAVRFTGEIAEQSFTLYQNRPNPFRESTVIGFVLPESTPATLTIYDVTGKVLKLIEGDYTKGYNEVSVLKSQLNASGILYYQLDSEIFTATRKMVVID